MEYGIFSDVHGDINLLEKLLNKFSEEGIKGICLGDIVHNGKTYDEKRCIDLIKEDGCYAIKGNHDKDAVKQYNKDKESKLEPDDIKFIKNLPEYTQAGEMILFHNSADLDKDFDVKREFSELKLKECNVGFFGHGHKRLAYKNGKVIELVNDKLFLNKGLYLINPGALWKEGLYGIYNNDNELFEFKQLS